ncbi:hypothetical protein [Salinimicrobium soli]|uniref:hypothetical protein n=1 Tax=Salinimicrobium soli TaxID=1254399 RepID=UPI003AAE9EF5
MTSVSCNDNERELEESKMQLDSLTRELANYKKRSDSLNLLLQKGELAKGYPVYFNSGFDTIENPKEFVATQLEKHPDLIPLKAELGGTMAFRDIQVISENWVLATYDDGHVQGRTIYSFEMQPNGELKFSPIASKLPK